MAIDYADYHPLFKRISRFVILIRANDHCEKCGVRNNSVGYWVRTRKGEPPLWVPHYVKETGRWFLAYSRALSYAKRYNLVHAAHGLPKRKVVKLACAHLDHDITHNELDNLASLCQGCHRHHDSADNADRRKYGPTGQHRNQPRLFTDSRYAPNPNVPRPVKKPRKKRRYERQTKSKSISKATSVNCESDPQ